MEAWYLSRQSEIKRAIDRQSQQSVFVTKSENKRPVTPSSALMRNRPRPATPTSRPIAPATPTSRPMAPATPTSRPKPTQPTTPVYPPIRPRTARSGVRPLTPGRTPVTPINATVANSYQSNRLRAPNSLATTHGHGATISSGYQPTSSKPAVSFYARQVEWQIRRRDACEAQRARLAQEEEERERQWTRPKREIPRNSRPPNMDRIVRNLERVRHMLEQAV